MKNLALLVALAATNVFAQDAPASATSTIVCVRDCGAKGDGSADDSAAFQKAFEQAVRADHAVVRIPAGAYRLGRQISVQFKGAVGNGLTVAGNGKGVAIRVEPGAMGVQTLNNQIINPHVAAK